MLPQARQEDEDEILAWEGYKSDDEDEATSIASENEQVEIDSEEKDKDRNGEATNSIRHGDTISPEDAEAIARAQREFELEMQRNMELEAFMQTLEHPSPRRLSIQQDDTSLNLHNENNLVTQVIKSLLDTLTIHQT